jgi:hypothetical protein
MSNTKLSLEQIQSRGEQEGFTAYQIWRILSAKLVEAGLEGWKRPQQMYNYDRNGLIVKGVKDVSKTRKFTRAEVDEFVNNQFEKISKKANEGQVTEEAPEPFDQDSDVEIEMVDADQMV